MNTVTIQWHRLMDGPPPKAGFYLVAHRGLARWVYYNPEGLHPGSGEKHSFTERRRPNANEPGPRKERDFPTEPWGWRESITWASHWAELPLPDDEAAIQLCKPAGAAAYIQAREAAEIAERYGAS